jgi:hypothetical protein
MGLDQYAYKIKKNLIADEIDIKLCNEEGELIVPEEAIDRDFFYWRKHHDLQGWMEKLYNERGGSREFNCVCIKLSEADLDNLEASVLDRKLPHTVGFFFGSGNTESYVNDDLKFIEEARSAMADGYDILYSSWW